MFFWKTIKSKYEIKNIKVGHAGTLDPLATGLLLVCTGKMTKKISELQNQLKTYTNLSFPIAWSSMLVF